MHVPEYDTRSDAVQKIYAFADADAAWASARSLGIDYLWLDATDRAAYPNAAKFADHPELFSPVFTGGDVVVYQLSRDGNARTSGSR